MKQTVLTILCFQLMCFYLLGQTQMHLEGVIDSNEPVAKIDINYISTPTLRTNGLEIDLNSAFCTGLYISGVGTGIRSEVSSAGIAGYFSSSYGVGLEGVSHTPSVFGYGVYGHNSRNGNGTGVYGWAEGPVGDNYGVKGQSDSPTGTGVYGFIDAANPVGIAYGVHGLANTPSGAGVFGENNMGPSVYGLATGIGIGVKGEAIRGQGGLFYSEFEEGVLAISDDNYGLRAESQNNSAAYFSGRMTDVVLGSLTNTEGSDDGIISSDLSKSTSDVHLVSNDQLIFELDDNDDENSFFQVLDGKNEKILTLEENGNLDIIGTLSQGSDINRKHSIESIQYNDILHKVSELDVYQWKYNGEDKLHIGPMAQDFYKAFKLNDDDTSIATVDIDGVALASIKALYEMIQIQQKQIESLTIELGKAKP